MTTAILEEPFATEIEAVHRACDRLFDVIVPSPAGLAGGNAGLTERLTQRLAELLEMTQRAEEAGAPPATLRAATERARAFCRASQTLAHAQDWPRGYAGDFQMVERLVDAVPAGEPGGLEHALDAVVLQLPIVEQHRAKVRWQANLVRQASDAAKRPLRVLSMACGGSRDLVSLEPQCLTQLTLVLADFDSDALALSERRLRERAASVVSVRGNVLRELVRLAALGPYDVVVIGGLLDYLPQRAARVLVTRALLMLRPGGVLGLTNIAAGNPYRHMLELLTNWTLLERDADEVRALFAEQHGTLTLERDATGLTWLARYDAPQVKP